MKVKILQLTTAFFLVGGALLSVSAYAQHEGLPPGASQDPNHLEYSLTDDKPLLLDHDSKSKGPTRDSIATHNKPLNGEDEDALSFNFLYYIIQKFKISDLIDE